MRATRRAFVRWVGLAVGAATTSVADGANGAGNRDAPDRCEPVEGDYPPMEGFVFFPESYRECSPFRLLIVSRRFRSKVGRGPHVCLGERREYVLYGIGYDDADADVTSIEGVSTFLAVRTPEEGDPPLPHEYFVPGQRFQFVSTAGEFVMHGDCEEPPTPLQQTVFSRVRP